MLGLEVTLDATAAALAALSSVLLGALGVWRSRGWRQRAAIAAACTAFGIEAAATYVLVSVTEFPDERLLWLQVVYVAGLVAPVAWGLVLATACHPKPARVPLGWRLAIGAGGMLALVGIAVTTGAPTFLLSEIPGPFHAVRLGGGGPYLAAIQLGLSVGVLVALEATLRSAGGDARWRLKYLILGLGGMFLARFYLQSHVLLFHVLLRSYLTTQAVTVIGGSVIVAASVLRMRGGGVTLTVSRQIVYRSIVIGVLGVYLFAVGALSWVLSTLGIAEEIFWISLVVFVTALGLAIVLLSEDVQWRTKRFIARHFYPSKYDYREQWAAFTKRLAAHGHVDAMASQLLEAVLTAVGTTRGALYLSDPHDESRYRLAVARGCGRLVPALASSTALVQRIAAERAPVLDATARWPELGPDADLGPAVAAVPLRGRERVTGVMLVGLDRTGTLYTTEDLEFLATVGEQAAIAIVSARQAEDLARAREFEAFHRVTSFVMHDIKNATAALSMLSDNAARHFDDPEFQRDALRTVVRTVERMKTLLARLAAAQEGSAVPTEPVDLSAIVEDVLAPLAGGGKATLVRDITPLPAVVGDADALGKVVQNLVTNAVESLRGDGVVAVKTYVDDGQAVISVSDTGCGMSEEFVQRALFTPFRSTKKAGWGIGLFQTKAIVEAHGGRIEVASKEGEGTTFRVKIPVHSAVREVR